MVSLYQYERITELTVFLSQAEAQVWEEDSVTLTAQVLPSSYQDQVTWSTSDASVATVDEHGVVTGIQGGTATITATSVDTNDGGEHATASCAVTVKSLGDLSAKVNAQVVTEDGAKWVTIDTASRAVTVNGDAGTALTAAGAHEGKLYGTDNNYPLLTICMQFVTFMRSIRTRIIKKRYSITAINNMSPWT